MKTMLTLAAVLAVSLTAAARPAQAAAEPAAPIVISAPPEGKGQIVFFRRGGIGPLISCAVSENGARVSRLPPGKYFVQVATPGPHTYTVSSEAKDTLNVEVEAGETQFAKCNIRMGILAGRPNLSPSTKEEFDQSAGKLKLVEPEDDKK